MTSKFQTHVLKIYARESNYIVILKNVHAVMTKLALNYTILLNTVNQGWATFIEPGPVPSNLFFKRTKGNKIIVIIMKNFN